MFCLRVQKIKHRGRLLTLRLRIPQISLSTLVFVTLCKPGASNKVSKGPQPSLWAASQAARVTVTISGIINRLNYCKILQRGPQNTT
jgi:hypothetical protein